MKKFIFFGAWILQGIFMASFSVPDDEFFKKAEAYYFQKKYEIALKMLEAVLEKTPDNAKALSYTGDIYLIKKDYDKAIQRYNQSVELSADPAMDYFRLGQVYTARKEIPQAKENYQKAYSLNPSKTASLFQLGYLSLVYERDKNACIRYWRDYVLRTPNDPQKEKIQKVIDLLKNPDFVIPPLGSDISLEEALIMGGKTSREEEVDLKDKTTGHEKGKISNESKGLLDDENL